MRPQYEFDAAIELVEEGYNDCEISRMLEIPRGTIRDWRHASIDNPGHRTTSATGDRRGSLPVVSTNPGGPCTGECDAGRVAMKDRPSYFYLLGQYLGDGDITRSRRGVYRLRISCTWDYPEIFVEVAEAMAAVSHKERVSCAEAKGHSKVYVSWKHWPCVFPQHGAGRKHERRIVLETWQRPRYAADHRWLIRGLIHSDGCRFINTVERPLKRGIKRYEYVRYVFTNASEDIRGIFTTSLDALDIDWRVMTRRNISIARRRSVAQLDAFVGPKR